MGCCGFSPLQPLTLIESDIIPISLDRSEGYSYCEMDQHLNQEGLTEH